MKQKNRWIIIIEQRPRYLSRSAEKSKSSCSKNTVKTKVSITENSNNEQFFAAFAYRSIDSAYDNQFALALRWILVEVYTGERKESSSYRDGSMNGEWPCLKVPLASLNAMEPSHVKASYPYRPASCWWREISAPTRTHARLRSPECRQFARSARSLHKGGKGPRYRQMEQSAPRCRGTPFTAVHSVLYSTCISIHTRRGGCRGRPREGG